MHCCKYNILSTATALLIGLALHGCHQHHLLVTDKKEMTTKAGAFMSSPRHAIEISPSRNNWPMQEGKQKGYLTKAIKLPINELGWELDCTPLHYAAAKGNP